MFSSYFVALKYSSAFIERFLNDSRKTNAKVITPTNHNRSEQRDKPIAYTHLLKAREKLRVQVAIDFGFASHWL